MKFPRLALAAALLALATQAQARTLLIGDSYMRGMAPAFKSVWPDPMQERAKIGAGINDQEWARIDNPGQYSFVFVSLGINDLPSDKQLNQQWASKYAAQVALLVERFQANTYINWIMPPCPAKAAKDPLARVRWEWLTYAINQGVKSAKRPLQTFVSTAKICAMQTADGVHYQPQGYVQMVHTALGI